MKKRKFSKRKQEEVDAILPFMSLLIIIIPLLLSNLAFYHFRIIETSRPGASDPDQAQTEIKPDKERKITAKLLIEPKISHLEFLDESDGRTLKDLKRSSDKAGAIDLFEYLQKIKKRFPKLNTVMITTHVDVIYEKMVNILDVFKTDLPEFVEESRDVAEISVEEKDGFTFNLVIMPAIAELSVK